MDFLFDNIEEQLISRLGKVKINRIWFGYEEVVFEFDDSYIELRCKLEIASSPNKGDEICTVTLKESKAIYEPSKFVTLIAEKPVVRDVQRVRTLIYFTPPISDPEVEKKLDSQWNRMLSRIAGVRKNKIEKLFEGSQSSYHDMIMCKPSSSEANEVDPKFANRIDLGLVIKTEKGFIPAFIWGNAVGFYHLKYKAFLSAEELDKMLDNCETY